jgi:hypothetical protein
MIHLMSVQEHMLIRPDELDNLNSLIFSIEMREYMPDVERFMGTFGAEASGHLLPKLDFDKYDQPWYAQVDGNAIVDIIRCHGFITKISSETKKNARKISPRAYFNPYEKKLIFDLDAISYNGMPTIIEQYYVDSAKDIVKMMFDLPYIIYLLVLAQVKSFVKQEYHDLASYHTFFNIFKYLFGVNLCSTLSVSDARDLISPIYSQLKQPSKKQVEFLKDNIGTAQQIEDSIAPMLCRSNIDYFISVFPATEIHAFGFFALTKTIFPIHIRSYRAQNLIRDFISFVYGPRNKTTIVLPFTNEIAAANTCKTCGIISEKEKECTCPT